MNQWHISTAILGLWVALPLAGCGKGDNGNGNAIASLGPVLSFVDEGQAGSNTFPEPLTVTLDRPASADTFVAIASSDETKLSVVGGGVTVPAGQASAQVVVNGIAQAPSVQLTATLGGSLTAEVRVLGPAEQPVIASLSPATASLAAGANLTLNVTLDFPARAPGTTIAIALTPGIVGTVPATVTVPAGQRSASFDYVDGGSATQATVTATLGASSAACAITLPPLDHLVISEVRSRGPAGGSDEFVELYNPSDVPVTLDATWILEARSSTAGSYGTRWTGTGKVIPAHGHFLIASSAYVQMPAADEALSAGITDATSLLLTRTGLVVDALCYGFDVSFVALIAGDGTYTCEGTPVSNNPHDNAVTSNTDASLERRPGGTGGSTQDTGDNATDFQVTAPAQPQNSASAPVP
jgi:hypothetical protein